MTQQITTCQHCGDHFATKRPDLRKRCDRCREIKAHLALGEYPRTCQAHDGPFYAHRYRQNLCPTCSLSPAGREADRDGAGCAFCSRRDRLLPGVALCYPCAAGPDTEHHTRVMHSLRKAWEKVGKDV